MHFLPKYKGNQKTGKERKKEKERKREGKRRERGGGGGVNGQQPTRPERPPHRAAWMAGGLNVRTPHSVSWLSPLSSPTLTSRIPANQFSLMVAAVFNPHTRVLITASHRLNNIHCLCKDPMAVAVHNAKDAVYLYHEYGKYVPLYRTMGCSHTKF